MTVFRASFGFAAVALVGACALWRAPSSLPSVATSPDQSAASAAVPDQPPPGPTRVTVYIKTVVDKRFGLLAFLAGSRDTIDRHLVYAPDNHWWDNPLVVYREQPHIATTDLTAGADEAMIVGKGTSTNVAVALSLIPHADVAVHTNPPSDGIKGTIQVRISAASDYFDGDWTPMARVHDKILVFTFNTCDPTRPLEATGKEVRSVSAFAFERYTRQQQKWDASNTWPSQPESGDWRITIAGNDATMDVTTYRYSSPPVAAK